MRYGKPKNVRFYFIALSSSADVFALTNYFVEFDYFKDWEVESQTVKRIKEIIRSMYSSLANLKLIYI